MESPVGMTRWNLLGWFLARRFLWKIILIDCHVQVRGPCCCLPKVHVDRALCSTRLENSLNHIWKKWSNMSWVTGAIIRDLKSRNRCWGRTLAEMTQWSQLQTAKLRVQKQNGEPLASHLRQWLGRWLHLKSLPQDLSWLRSNCLLADGLLKQWMLHCRKKRTRRPCETARSMHVFWLARAALERLLSF